jgi:BMFP domain-containing protein YqiC
MQSRNRLFDDAAKLAGGAIGTLTGMRREIEALVRQQIERFMAGMDLVTRDEFDAVKAMAAKAREEQEALGDRVATLEAALAAGGGKKPAPRSGGRKPASGSGKGTGQKS